MYDYLYALQTIREGWGSVMIPIMTVISEFANTGILVVIFLLFLCVNKRKYAPMLFALSTANFVTNAVKAIATVYRPWINDSRLYPDPHITKTATGYSFPSGHTTAGAVFYGNLALNESRGRKRKWLIAILIVMIVLTAFSRNFLGAHTLPDVTVAILIGLLSVIGIDHIFRRVQKHPDEYKYFLAGALIVSIIIMIYVILKPYPMDYAADGTLLADPAVLKKDTFLSAGMFMGLLIAWYVDKNFINFTTDGLTLARRIVRGLIGSLLFALLYLVILKKLSLVINPMLGSFIRAFGTLIVCLNIYPAIFTAWEKKHPIKDKTSEA